ncbi:putative (R)-2-hydroxyglutaryl-CoA dehydratase activator [delta proteobacterium NaphS2]|nr:putative (R)-2-hydroxyglutaryl-CoA dehydratase activator [delta proteobacterium NaphS2]
MQAMITAGIDLGATYSKVVILDDGKVVGKGISKTTLEPEESVEKALNAALQEAKIDKGQVERTGVTGSGRRAIKDADVVATDVTADARGAYHLDKEVKTVIDVGGEDARAVKVGENGKVINSAVNDKCAAGAGAFVEAMSRAMQLSLEEFAEASLKSTQEIPINAQCAIFAESEVVSLISDETPREDICRAVHDGIADRITSMAKRVLVEEKVGLMGGAVMNKGLVESIREGLGLDPIILPDPLFVSALGIALMAADQED